MAAASSPNSLQQAASAVFAVTTVLPLLIFVWTLYRLGTLSRLHSQLGLGLALAVALLGFYFFRRLMGRMSELIQGLGRAVERSARPIAERQPHATGHPPAGLITEYQPPIAGSPPHAAQVVRPASGRVATAVSAPTSAAAPHAVEAAAPAPSARAIPGLGMIREVDDLSHAMAKLWMGEAIGHKGRRVALSVMNSRVPITGTLVDLTHDGLFIEQDGVGQVAVSYSRLSGIDAA